MSQPRLGFACELDPARLTALFSGAAVIADLQARGAHVALMHSDLSAERAAVVRRLNTAGIPVVAIPLMPVEETPGMGQAARGHPPAAGALGEDDGRSAA